MAAGEHRPRRDEFPWGQGELNSLVTSANGLIHGLLVVADLIAGRSACLLSGVEGAGRHVQCRQRRQEEDGQDLQRTAHTSLAPK